MKKIDLEGREEFSFSHTISQDEEKKLSFDVKIDLTTDPPRVGGEFMAMNGDRAVTTGNFQSAVNFYNTGDFNQL